MDNMQDMLGKFARKEPPEISGVKNYILDKFHVAVSVGIKGETIVVTVPSAALANTLRFHISKLQTTAETDKRIVLRIG